MKKKTRTLIILGAVFIICIGAYIGVSVYSRNQAQLAAEETKVTSLYTAGMSAPASLSYVSGGKMLSFVLENNTWRVADNKDFPLTQSSVTNIASTLQSLTAVRTLDMPLSTSAYGLDMPLFTISATDSGGNVMKLLIGAPNSDYYYAMLDGGDKIYTIASTLVSYLNTDLMSMIILDTIPALGESSIDTITLSSGAALLTLDKHQNKDSTFTWFIVEGTTYTAADEFILPVGAERSPEKYISNAVAALSSADFTSCTAFKPTAEALKTFGLDVPQITATVNYTITTGTGLNQTATKETVVLEIGQALSDASGYHARIQGSQEINVLSNDTVEPLISALTALSPR